MSLEYRGIRFLNAHQILGTKSQLEGNKQMQRKGTSEVYRSTSAIPRSIHATSRSKLESPKSLASPKDRTEATKSKTKLSEDVATVQEKVDVSSSVTEDKDVVNDDYLDDTIDSNSIDIACDIRPEELSGQDKHKEKDLRDDIIKVEEVSQFYKLKREFKDLRHHVYHTGDHLSDEMTGLEQKIQAINHKVDLFNHEMLKLNRMLINNTILLDAMAGKVKLSSSCTYFNYVLSSLILGAVGFLFAHLFILT